MPCHVVSNNHHNLDNVTLLLPNCCHEQSAGVFSATKSASILQSVEDIWDKGHPLVRGRAHLCSGKCTEPHSEMANGTRDTRLAYQKAFCEDEIKTQVLISFFFFI